jgi:hypothetical protein
VGARPGWRNGGFSRLQRWSLIAVASLVLLGALAVLLAFLRGSSDDATLALSLPPPATRDARGLDPNEILMAPPHGPDPSRPLPGAGRPADDAHAPAAPDAPAAPAATAGARSAAAHTPTPQRAATPASPDGADRTEYKLLIRPWGTVYVDGQDRGVSPPLKRLALPAGKHTVRIVNPAYPDRVLRIESGCGASGRIVHDFSTSSR